MLIDTHAHVNFKSFETDAKEVFVIGGGEVFKQVFKEAHRIYITRVHADVSGDVYFPEVRESEWRMISNRPMQKDSRHAFDYSFQVWERKATDLSKINEPVNNRF